MLPETSGLKAIEQIHQLDAKLPVIFITASGASETAIEAMKQGAFDYLFKPLDVARVQDIVEQALEMRRLMQIPVMLPDAAQLEEQADQLVGRSPQMLEVYKAIGRVAPQDVTVLIRGESGTGKELIARAIYHHSRRSNGPFLAVNCAAITETLLESELFGHEKGAFTGADQRRIGKFEQCSGGTIFMDEIGDMSPLLQSKVLRLLQEQRFERVGGNTTIQTDVRVIAATNRDLEKMVADGDFREDLFYRINGFSIDLPPLRERGSDIVMLLEHFLAMYRRQMGKDIHGVSPDAMDMLTKYHWPGNVRELQGVLKRALLQATGPVIIPEFLPKELRAGSASRPQEGDSLPSDLKSFIDERLRGDSTELYNESLEMMERYLLTRVISLTHGNQSMAAKMLGITRGSLRHKLRTLGISIEQVFSIESRDREEEEVSSN
jgi:two-component system nitrogen regulation response regulator GlnG